MSGMVFRSFALLGSLAICAELSYLSVNREFEVAKNFVMYVTPIPAAFYFFVVSQA